MQNLPPGGGPALRPMPPATVDTQGGVTHRLRRAWMRLQLERTVDGIRQANVYVPSTRRLADFDDDHDEFRLHQASRALVDRLQGFGASLAASDPDAKAARAVVVPVLLGRYKAMAGWVPSYAMAVTRITPGEPTNLFDGLCNRTLAALDLRANPRNLSHVLSQLEPPSGQAGSDDDFSGVGPLIARIAHTLAQPRLSAAHAGQLVDFVMRPNLHAVPGPWLASAMRGLQEAWRQLDGTGSWPPGVDVRARMIVCVARMSLGQLQALGRYGPALGALFGPVLRQALPPGDTGAYLRGVLQRAGGASDDLLGRFADCLVSREVLDRALEAPADVVFATACALACELGEERAQEVWEQVVVTADRHPQPDPGRVAMFELGVRLARTPLKVMGEPGLPLADRLRLLQVMDAVAGVPLTALGWMQLAAIHQVDDVDADLFVAARPHTFIRQVFEAERDRAWAALLAAYPARKDPKNQKDQKDRKDHDSKASHPRGFPAHVPEVGRCLTALLTSFDSYERRATLDRPRRRDDPQVAACRQVLQAQGTWLKQLPMQSDALREVRWMLQLRIERMQATLEEAVGRAGWRTAFENPSGTLASSPSSSTTTASSSIATSSSPPRREGKGDEPDGPGRLDEDTGGDTEGA